MLKILLLILSKLEWMSQIDSILGENTTVSLSQKRKKVNYIKILYNTDADRSVWSPSSQSKKNWRDGR